jgi:leader peptidase (prepilin peptidase)/N-methyltransferase
MGNPWVFLAGAAGLAVGSFLNVCIYRLPRSRSIVFPGSRCPACGAPIRAFDNIPVLSWLILRGKCRVCRAPISLRYPMIEMGNASLWILAAATASRPADFAAAACLCSACLVLIMIDYDFQILPDSVTLPLAGTGVFFSFFSSRLGWRSSLAGLAAGAGVLFLVAWAYEKLTRSEGMGLGDAKMLGAIGAFTGVAGVVATLFFASLAGSLVGLALMTRGGGWKTRLPFGVFLGLAGIGAYFWGSPLFLWYRGLFS